MWDNEAGGHTEDDLESDELDALRDSVPQFLRLSMRAKVATTGLIGLVGLGVLALGFFDEISVAWEETVFSGLEENTRSLQCLGAEACETSDLIKTIIQEPLFFNDWVQVTWTVCLTHETEGRPGFIVESQYYHVTKNRESGGTGNIGFMVEWVNSTCFQTVPRPQYERVPTKAPLLYFYQSSVQMQDHYVVSSPEMRWLTDTDITAWEDFREAEDKIGLRLRDGPILEAVLPRWAQGTTLTVFALQYGENGCGVRSGGSAIHGRRARMDLGEYGLNQGSTIHIWPDLPPGLSLVVKPGSVVFLITATTKDGDILTSDIALAQSSHHDQ